MTAFAPVIHDTAANTHAPLAATDTLLLTPAQVADLQTQLGLPDDDQTATQVPVSPAVAGATNVQAALEALAALVASDNAIASMSYNAATGVLTVTDADANVFTVTITDAEIGTATAPATVIDPAIPTTYYGSSNAARLGNPDGWFSINGKKVPFWN